jgi:hypothetical protein
MHRLRVANTAVLQVVITRACTTVDVKVVTHIRIALRGIGASSSAATVTNTHERKLPRELAEMQQH